MKVSDYIDAARRAAGADHFHSDSFLEGLSLLADGYERSPILTERGRMLLDGWMINGLKARLQIDDWIARHPQLATTDIEAPVFIVGLPRTGSSAMQCVLAVDERLRLLWRWEVDDPTPPADKDHLHDDPRLIARKAEWEEYHAAGMVGPHAELPEDPTECTTIMQQDFKSLTYEHAIDNPDYRNWLFRKADMVAAFRNHKRNLQVLQSRAPGQWVLKFPPHSLDMDAIRTVYPDARFVVLHRDPVVATASYCDLNDFYRWMVSEKRDPVAVGEQIVPQLLEHVSRLMNYRDAHPETPVLDVHYRDFRRDPIAALKPIYAFMGMDFPEILQRRMLDYLEERGRRPFGKHDYALETFGLSADRTYAAFDDYIRRYDVPVERKG